MKKIVLLLVIVTIFNRILGFFRDVYLAQIYGTTFVADAYIIAITVPVLLSTFLSEAIRSSFIPIYSQIKSSEGKKNTSVFTFSLTIILILLSIVILTAILIFPEFFVKIVASGFEGEVLSLAVSLTRLTSFSILFVSLTSLFKAILQINNKFVIAEMVVIPQQIIVIFSIYLSSIKSLNYLGYFYILSIAAPFFVLLIYSLFKKYFLITKLDIKDSNLKQLLIMILPILFSVAISDINAIIDKNFASILAEGSVSAMNYATKLNQFIQSVFVITLTTVYFPLMSKMANQEDKNGFLKVVHDNLSVIIISIVPISIFVLTNSIDLVRVLYQRGNFDEQSVLVTAFALQFYSIGMLFFSLKQIIVRAFYATGNTSVPTYNALIAVVFNLILNFIFINFTELGVGGLALATSISVVLSVSLLFYQLRKRIGDFDAKGSFKTFLLVLIASIMTMFIVCLINVYVLNMISNLILKMFILLGITFTLYITFILVLKVELVSRVFSDIFKKLLRGFK